VGRFLASVLVSISLVTLALPGCRTADDQAGLAVPQAVAIQGRANAGEAAANAAAPAEEVTVWITTFPRLSTPGRQVTLTGQGFAGGETVAAVLLDAAGAPVAGPTQATTDPRGAVTAMALPLPPQLAPGEYTVAVRGQTSQRVGRTVLWVQAAPPTMALSRDASPPEAQLAITATGFVPRERVVIYFEGHGAEPLTALAADQAGNIRAENVVVPLLPPGEQRLVATGSTSMAQARLPFRILQFDPVVVLNASTLPSGEAAGFFGHGFAARDRIEVTLEGSTELPLVLTTDDRGRLRAPQSFRLPTNLKGQQTFALRAPRTARTVRTTFLAISSYPVVELSSYIGQPGSEVSLAVRGLRARERLEVAIGQGSQRKKVATFRADDNGNLTEDSRFRIPQDATAGALTFVLEGEAARTPIRLTYIVSP